MPHQTLTGLAVPPLYFPRTGPVRAKRARKIVPTVSKLVKPELRRNLFPWELDTAGDGYHSRGYTPIPCRLA